jgi:hypothetical protein
MPWCNSIEPWAVAGSLKSSKRSSRSKSSNGWGVTNLCGRCGDRRGGMVDHGVMHLKPNPPVLPYSKNQIVVFVYFLAPGSTP